MKELLVSEIISRRSDFNARIRLINQFLWEQQVESSQLLENIIDECKEAIETTEDSLEKAELFLDCLYRDLLFIETDISGWDTAHFDLETALATRKMAPALKLMLVEHIAIACGFEADVVFVPNSYMVRILCDAEYAIIFDVVSGEAINWLELDRRMGEMEGNPREIYLYAESSLNLTVHYLTQLKNSAINQQLFDIAFKCITLLKAFSRNQADAQPQSKLLLQASDCFKLQYDDYRQFNSKTQQTPDDILLQLAFKQLELKESPFH